MSAPRQRLQVASNQHQHDRVSAEAKRSGRTMAEVVRSAIDVRFPPDDDKRRAGIRDLLALSTVVSGHGQDWAIMKAQEVDELDRKLSGD